MKRLKLKPNVILVLLFASAEGRVQQDPSHLELIINNLVQLLLNNTIKKQPFAWAGKPRSVCYNKWDRARVSEGLEPTCHAFIT